MRKINYLIMMILISFAIINSGCGGGGASGGGEDYSSFGQNPLSSPTNPSPTEPNPTSSPSVSPTTSPMPTPSPSASISPFPSPSPSVSPTNPGPGPGPGPNPQPDLPVVTTYSFDWNSGPVLNIPGHPCFIKFKAEDSNEVGIPNYAVGANTITRLDATDGSVIGTVEDQLILRPVGIACNDIFIYVASQGNDSIVRYGINWNTPTTIINNVSGTNTGILDVTANSLFVAVLYKTDTEWFIKVYDTSGTEQGFSNWTYAGFNNPSSIAISELDNKIYITDRSNNRILVFQVDGGIPTSIGSTGSTNGKFNNPVDIDVDEKYIYVTDLLNYRVQVFLLDGTFQGIFGTKGAEDSQFNAPSGITSDGFGNFFVTDIINNNCQYIKKN